MFRLGGHWWFRTGVLEDGVIFDIIYDLDRPHWSYPESFMKIWLHLAEILNVLGLIPTHKHTHTHRVTWSFLEMLPHLKSVTQYPKHSHSVPNDCVWGTKWCFFGYRMTVFGVPDDYVWGTPGHLVWSQNVGLKDLQMALRGETKTKPPCKLSTKSYFKLKYDCR